MSLQIIPLLLKEMEQEAETTRKMLSIVPEGKFDWQPHRKSMTLRQLATHVAELPGWVALVLTTTELDFASNPYVQEPMNTAAEVLAYFETSLASGRNQLEQATEPQLEEMWTLRNGDVIYSNTTKYEFIRISYSQIVHHRAQLGVYLRLLDVPIPGSYGPSADELGL